MRVPKADRDAELLKATEEELAEYRKTEARLIAEIAELKGSLPALARRLYMQVLSIFQLI